MLSKFKEKFIGNRGFYKMVLLIAVPIMIQNGITNFVNMLDNIMVGQIGTMEMSGVAIVNQLIFVYNLCIFGGISGAGIFTAQYFGQKDEEGVRSTFRLKLWIALFITVLATLIFILFGKPLISLYLNDADINNVTTTYGFGLKYLRIMLIGLPGFMIVQSYSSTLRECGETVLPMLAGVAAVFVNLIFNYILIFGKFGAPALGVEGAAIATVMSRYAEALIVAGWTHYNKEKLTFIKGLYRTMKVPGTLIKKVIIKGTPLMLNETVWSIGVAVLTQCYSLRGLDVVAGLNIAYTIGNVFNVVFIALGNATAIIVGQRLGAGLMKEARDVDNKMIVFSVLSCLAAAFIMLFCAPVFPLVYNTEPLARQLATGFIMIQALFMPLVAFTHATYFTLRAGGKTGVTFFFDSGFIFLVSVPIAFLLSNLTSLPVLVIFAVVQSAEIMKCVIGFILVKKGSWLQNIVDNA